MKKPPLAWFFLTALSDESPFRRDVEAHGGTYEGIGESPQGVVEGYAVFLDVKHLASFRKKYPAYVLNDYVL